MQIPLSDYEEEGRKKNNTYNVCVRKGGGKI